MDSIIFNEDSDIEIPVRPCPHFKGLWANRRGEIFRMRVKASNTCFIKVKQQPDKKDKYIRIHTENENGEPIHTTAQKIVYDAFNEDFDPEL